MRLAKTVWDARRTVLGLVRPNEGGQGGGDARAGEGKEKENEEEGGEEEVVDGIRG